MVSPGSALWMRRVYACAGACGRTVPDFDADGGRFLRVFEARAVGPGGGDGTGWPGESLAPAAKSGAHFQDLVILAPGVRGKRRHSPPQEGAGGSWMP